MNFQQEQLAYDEIEISISRIVKNCVKQVKWIILIAIIFAITIPSLIYIKDTKEYSSRIQSVQNAKLKDEQNENVEKYFFFKRHFQYCENYIENAPIMDIDFSGVYQGELQYHIKAESNIKEDIAAAMVNYINSQVFVKEFCEKLVGLDVNYANELLDSSVTDGVVSIHVIGASEEICSAYIKHIKDLVLVTSEELKQIIGEHEVVLIQESISCGYSKSVYEQQSIAQNNLQNAEKALLNHISNLSESDKINILMIDDTDTLITTDELKEPVFDFKFVLVGFLLGLVICVGIIVVYILSDGKLQTDKELVKRLNIVHIGTVSKRINAETEDIKVITKKIIKLAEDNRVEKINFVGSKDIINLKQTKELFLSLEEFSIYSSIIGNVLTQQDIIEELSNNVPVILIESIGKTKIKDVYEEATLCKDLGVEILGYICIAE